MNDDTRFQLLELINQIYPDLEKRAKDQLTSLKKWNKVKDDPRILNPNDHPDYPYNKTYNKFYYDRILRSLDTVISHLKFYYPDD